MVNGYRGRFSQLSPSSRWKMYSLKQFGDMDMYKKLKTIKGALEFFFKLQWFNFSFFLVVLPHFFIYFQITQNVTALLQFEWCDVSQGGLLRKRTSRTFLEKSKLFWIVSNNSSFQILKHLCSKTFIIFSQKRFSCFFSFQSITVHSVARSERLFRKI